MTDRAEVGSEGSAEQSTRRRAIDDAIKVWRGKLINLTGTNRLIFYKPLKVGTLDLARASSSQVNRLLDGEEVRATELFPLPGPPPGGVTDDDIEALRRETDAAQRLRDDALKRLKTLLSTGRANEEERGIKTLSLAFGTATWDPGETTSATPNAPILLRSLSIEAVGGGNSDYVLRVEGDWEVSQTLLIFWAEMFGLDLAAAGLDERALADATEDGDLSPEALLDLVMSRADASSAVINELRAEHALFAGNFVYTNLPIVRDLELNADALAESEIISAIAGDADAADALRVANSLSDVPVSLPDSIALDDEFLILDADASQSFVLNAVQSGRSLIVEGPPGTGKSQTIANLVAGLAARGQSVLFVAEKRAAIEAVKKRLESPGFRSDLEAPDLSVLALDLHTSGARKREIAEAMGASLNLGAGPVDIGLLHGRLDNNRRQVVDYERALHHEHDDYGVSYFAANLRVLEHSGAPAVSLGPLVLEKYSPEWEAATRSDVERWAATRSQIDWVSPWVNGRIDTQDDARRQVERARLLLNELDLFRASLEAASETTSLDLAVLSLQEVAEFAELLVATADVSDLATPEIWSLDLHMIADAYYRRNVLSPLSGAFRGCRRLLTGALKEKVSAKRQSEIVAQAAETRAAWSRYSEEVPDLSELDPHAFQQQAGSVILRAQELGEFLGGAPSSMQLEELEEATADLLATERDALLVAVAATQRASIAAEGLEPILVAVEAGEVELDDVGEATSHSVMLALRQKLERDLPEIVAFDSPSHSKAVGVYSALDREHVRSGPARVLRAVAERSVAKRSEYPKQDALIEREARKSRNHRGLRSLHEEAGEVLTALRPCWMMSPLLVAQMLPPRPIFDYVVFDEASQIRPEEAISALLRGRNVVVAGDRRQLPPSAFFGGAMDGSTALEDYDEDEIDPLTDGYESLLDVMSALLPGRMLTWHYRSEDDRLIKLSNDHLYSKGLTTFPSCVRDSPVRFVKVDHTPVDDSEIRSNPTEVARVVDLMFEHASETDDSLGVIAFGQHHATAIEAERDRRLAQDDLPDHVVAFFDNDGPERPFVKNIERVQGDERDSIILTVGYGFDRTGKVPKRFGPVNHEGGERRINVAASRARRRMTIVSSITHADFNPSGMKMGVHLLNHLLRFAESGGTDSGGDPDLVPLNAFELAVDFELRALGLEPIAQYGASGFRIDFALPDPEDRSRMVLAVEADGASYHSSQTARDRDRLRQQVLEAKGWRFHRIWSTAFFNDPKGEAERVKAAYEAALRGDEPESHEVASAAVVDASVPGVRRPRVQRGKSIDQYDHQQLVALARWILDDGRALLTRAEAKQRMLDELGFQRLGKKIEAAFDRALTANGVAADAADE